AAYAAALFLLALLPGQRALSVHRPARTCCRFLARRPARGKARQVGDAARTGGRGRRDLPAGRAVVVARRSVRTPRAEPAAQEGAHLYGVDAAARRLGPTATLGVDDPCGFALA